MELAAARLTRLVDEIKEEVILWRRHLHQHPELSYREEKTAQFVYHTLKSFGQIELSRPTRTSVVGRLTGKLPGTVLAIRADMDALPITEENDFSFVSQNRGVMHACGHDGHTAMLLGAAKILAGLREELSGEIRFLFQHAEEQFPGGAEEMVQAGVMEGVDIVIGNHLMSQLPVGKIGVTYGRMMAASDEFYLTINGKGGHGGMPHHAVDCIAIGSQVVANLQHIVARNVDPLDSLVLSVTQFHGGTATNVIPDTVALSGTVRSFDSQLRESMPARMEQVIKGICEAHGASYDFTYRFGYRAVVNDHAVSRVIEESVREVLGDESFEEFRPVTGGEDFSAFLQKTQGAFFVTGAGNPAKGITYAHHHPRFTIDEDALENGVKMAVYAACKLLGDRSR